MLFMSFLSFRGLTAKVLGLFSRLKERRGAFFERWKVRVRDVLNETPQNFWSLHTILWWGSAGLGGFLLVIFRLIAYGVHHTIGTASSTALPMVGTLYGLFLLAFSLHKEHYRHNVAELKSSRLGHIYVWLWAETLIEIVVLNYLADAYVAVPLELWFTTFGVILTRMITSWSKHSANKKKEKKKK